ncbi:hypothetical protein M1403_02420 [Patescibacteria group bacterium]|nr:hypothetical protein [Patescibacteria group bacterium]
MKIGLAVLILLLFVLVPKPVLADADFCPGPGNNLIDNISPQVLENLHTNAGSPNCWLTATFLLRTNDLSSPNLKIFFQKAAENKIFPIIRIGTENSGSKWPAFTTQLAQTDATYLNQAVAASGFPKEIYVEMGNEVNAADEWGGNPSPESYAATFIPFAENLSAVKIMLPPLILNPAAAIDYNTYYLKLKQALDQQLSQKFSCSLDIDPLDRCRQKIDDWLDTNISAYALNLYPPPGVEDTGQKTGYILADKDKVLKALQDTGFKIDSKKFLITEIGLANGVYPPPAGEQACHFYQAILNSSQGNNFLAATIYSRDDRLRVHAYYYPTGACSSSTEYDKGNEKSVINLGGSVTYGSGSGYPQDTSIVYPPLGSLEQCPDATKAQTTQTCSPTNQPGNICNSECSPPLEIDQNLQLSDTGSCLTNGSGTCYAQIKIQDNKIPVPGQIQQLGDYFERLVPYFTSPTQQNDLRCKFIKYVKDNPNSKYKDLKIDGKLVSSLPCDPTLAGWSQIPLVPNDDSLGKIEFVSPSLATVQPVTVSLPEIQRLNLSTKILQQALVPTQTYQPKTYGKAITLNLENNACNPTPTWENLYGADLDRGVSCNFGNLKPLAGQDNLSGCVLLPDGTLECQRNEAGGTPGYRQVAGAQATVQIRTVFPHLFEASEQSISFMQGFLQLFRPEEVEKFKEAYTPIPAAVDGVKYELTGSSGLAINDAGHKQNGWQLFFYNLGGIWNARNFVFQTLGLPVSK